MSDEQKTAEEWVIGWQALFSGDAKMTDAVKFVRRIQNAMLERAAKLWESPPERHGHKNFAEQLRALKEPPS